MIAEARPSPEEVAAALDAAQPLDVLRREIIALRHAVAEAQVKANAAAEIPLKGHPRHRAEIVFLRNRAASALRAVASMTAERDEAHRALEAEIASHLTTIGRFKATSDQLYALNRRLGLIT